MTRLLSLSLRLLGIVASGKGEVALGVRQNPTQDNGAPLSVIKRVLWRRGRGERQNPTKILAPLLSVIKIIKYCGQKCNAYKQYNCILPVTN